MKTINLRDYYPSLYTSDCFIVVPDEVKNIFIEFKQHEAAYQSRKYYNKAQYSLDRNDGIESHILYRELSPDEIYERKVTMKQLLEAVATLPEKQARRIYAHYFLGVSKSAIARMECVDEGSIRRSIQCGLRHIGKLLKKFV